MKYIIILALLTISIFATDSYFEYGKKVELTKIDKTRTLHDSDVVYYQNRHGQKVGVKNEIIIKCKTNEDCYDVFKKYNFNNTQKISNKFFHIILNKKQNVFKLSTKLYHEKNVSLAHPNFIKKRIKR